MNHECCPSTRASLSSPAPAAVCAAAHSPACRRAPAAPAMGPPPGPSDQSSSSSSNSCLWRLEYSVMPRPLPLDVCNKHADSVTGQRLLLVAPGARHTRMPSTCIQWRRIQTLQVVRQNGTGGSGVALCAHACAHGVSCGCQSKASPVCTCTQACMGHSAWGCW